MKEADVIAKAKKVVLSCLKDVPFVRTTGTSRRGSFADFAIRLDVNGRPWELLIETKTNGQPRVLRQAATQLRSYLANQPRTLGVLVAPYISDEGARICEEQGVGYVDLAGNCRLVFGTVFVERQGRPNPFVSRRDLLSLYRPKAARILRVLLGGPMREWKLKELAAEADVSLGHVSNVKRALLDREFAAAGTSGLRLTKPDVLLADWAENYDLRQREARDYYSLDGVAGTESELAAAASRVNAKVALTALSAAARLAPFVKYQRATAYILGNEDRLAKELDLKKVDSGANVTLLIPKDNGIFYGASEIDGGPVVSPIQAYLDLITIRGRGEEAAEFLLKEVIQPRW